VRDLQTDTKSIACNHKMIPSNAEIASFSLTPCRKVAFGFPLIQGVVISSATVFTICIRYTDTNLNVTILRDGNDQILAALESVSLNVDYEMLHCC
jgi:hypothetical protein